MLFFYGDFGVPIVHSTRLLCHVRGKVDTSLAIPFPRSQRFLDCARNDKRLFTRGKSALWGGFTVPARRRIFQILVGRDSVELAKRSRPTNLKARLRIASPYHNSVPTSVLS